MQPAPTLQLEALEVRFNPFIKVGLSEPLQSALALQAQIQALTLLLALTLQLEALQVKFNPYIKVSPGEPL